MYEIWRVDANPRTNEVSFFHIQSAPARDGLYQSREAARESGFVGPDDTLIVINNGEIVEVLH